MKKLWFVWAALSVGLAAYLFYPLLQGDDKSAYLIGETSSGHYQFELECSACHSGAFSSEDVMQQACVDCHAAELEQSHDSHPKKKFNDPREAYRLETIDARYCVSCHTEHQPEHTRAMGVTLPDDYCFHCHQDVVKERDSHKDLAFDSCASAGCHNYHDNRALYEDFLVSNADQPWLLETAKLTRPNNAALHAHTDIAPAHAAFAERVQGHPDIAAQWHDSGHQSAGVSCNGCHATQEAPDSWIEKPGLQQCATCHTREAERFTLGKHGVRLSASMALYDAAVSPAEARLAFTPTSQNAQQGCNSCHQAHSFDTRYAAVDACLSCHADEHSLAYKASAHGQLWAQGGSADTVETVSCASCHMPVVKEKKQGKTIAYVDHNQNHNLRPNEKMIRSVCMDCHGLRFAIDALADPELLRNNFGGKPGTKIESVDWALERALPK